MSESRAGRGWTGDPREKRRASSTLLLVALLAALLSAGCRAGALPEVRDGDLIFHTSRSSQSIAIQRATGSPYSHMGVVFIRDGRPFVFEAISRVRDTPLATWIARGEGGHFVLKRLRTPLTAVQAARLKAAAPRFEGKPYDLAFEWSDRRIYCSELVWKLYERTVGVRIGELQQLRTFNLENAAVRAGIRERYGAAIPFDEPVISPAAMFSSSLLVTVAEK